MVKLYFFHGATCGLKARLSLEEKQVDFIPHAVERNFLRTAEYRKLNKNGVVPTLIHDNKIIVESSVVINYVDDAFEGPALKPVGPEGTARSWWWLKRADECLAMIGTLTYTVSLLPKIRSQSPEAIEAYIENTPIAALRQRRRKMVEHGFDNPDFPIALEGLQSMLSDMEEALAKNAWLISNNYTLADTAMTPLIERLEELACEGMWQAKRPRVTDWWQRIKARPSYVACLGETPNPERPQHQKTGKRAWPDLERILGGLESK